MADPHVIDLTRPPAPPASRPVIDAPQHGFSPLDALAEDLAAKKTAKKVALKVREREGWVVEYDARLDLDMLGAWRARCRQPSPDGTEELNQPLYERTVLAGQCRRMYYQGTLVTDEQGHNVTFGNESLWRIVGVPAGSPDGAVEAVRKFYDNDFDIDAACNRLLLESGFGREAEVDTDPTRRR